MELLMCCRYEERIWMKSEGWPVTKAQVRAFPLGQSIIVLTNDQGTFLDRKVNNCTICI